MKIKKRVALYMTASMHQELKEQAGKLGLDMGAYVVHLLMLMREMREKEVKRNAQTMGNLS